MSSFDRIDHIHRRVWFLFAFSVFVFAVGYSLFSILTAHYTAEARRPKEANRLVQEFNQDIERAKRATAYPCATVFYELVAPPTGLNGAPRLIMMGQEIPAMLEPSAYFLWPKGDRVELWMNLSPPAIPPTQMAIAEKFAPDSSRCRDKK